MPFETKGLASLDSVVNVRLTSVEKDRLKADAEAAGMSMSELVRAQYFRRKIVAQADAVMINELRKIGGLLKHVHNESGGAYSEQSMAALREVEVLMKQLSAGASKK